MKKISLLLLVLGVVIIAVFCWPSFLMPESNLSQFWPFRESITTKRILFVGDIMLDRGVEYQVIKNNNNFYPFERVKDFFHQFDLVAANLEGPIVENPTDFPDSSLQFAFSSSVALSLKEAGADVVSLANNHTQNMKQEGLAETKSFLTQAGISFIGDPIYCYDTPVYRKDGIVVLGFNITFPFNCSIQEITDVVKAVRASSSDDFLVVFMHWGEEYQLVNSIYQQDLAHNIINEGADLIIGSHPHVVQNIEEYNGKLIFYSLGNFIFDQYFSDEVQQGLAVGVSITGHGASYQLYPISEGKAQPFLTNKTVADTFLNKLAQRSSQNLFEEIKRGIIKK